MKKEYVKPEIEKVEFVISEDITVDELDPSFGGGGGLPED